MNSSQIYLLAKDIELEALDRLNALREEIEEVVNSDITYIKLT